MDLWEGRSENGHAVVCQGRRGHGGEAWMEVSGSPSQLTPKDQAGDQGSTRFKSGIRGLESQQDIFLL